MRTTSQRARTSASAPQLVLFLVFLSMCLHEEAEAARGKKEPCRARHPRRDFELTDGICMPVHECLQSLSEVGRLKFPIFCGVRVLLPIVCCPLPVRTASQTSTTAPEPARPPVKSRPQQAPVMLAGQPEALPEASAACETPSGQRGRCLPMEGCEALREQVMSKNFPPLCDLRGTTAYACCPTLDGSRQTDTPVTTPPPTDAPAASTDYALRMLLLKLENSRHCGKSTGESPRFANFRSSPTVVRGRSVNLGKYPFMVAIYRDEVSVLNYWCGGTLITYWVVLSAAHCFAYSLNDTKYIVRVGGVNISDTSDNTFLQRNVASVHVHPEYDDRRHYNDVALLRLELPARHRSVKLSFACLPDAASSPPPATHGLVATVLGWGHNAFGGTLQTTLQEAQVPVVDNDACDQAYRSLGSYDRQFPSGVNEHFVCAGNTTEGGADACQQDSGGPLIVNIGGRADEAYEVIGVVSFGVGCGTAAYPGVYSRVSYFLPWILNTTAMIVPEDTFSTNFI